MFNHRETLLKYGWRKDSIWTHPFFYRSFLKYIPLYFDTFALMQSQYWPREKLSDMQDLRVGELLENAQRIPYWRAMLDVVKKNGTPLEVLSRLPVTAKKELIDRKLADISDTSLILVSDEDHTSGSTGRPFHFYFDWRASLRSFAVTERIFLTAGEGKRYPIVYMRARERNGFTPWRHIWFFLQGHHSVANRMNEFAALAKRYPRGFILYGYTSSVLEVARQMEKLGLRLPLKSVMAAGEDLLPADRSYLEKTMGTEVFTLYASREAGFLGYECEKHRMHLSEEWAYVEIVGENGTRVPDGQEGRVVVTTFDNRVMPFIRYDIGDRGVVSASPCPCGRTLKTITLRGRTAHLIELEGGRRVSLLDISTTLDRFWDVVRQYQVIQTGPLSFVLKIVAGENFDDTRLKLEGALRRLLHPEVKLSWERVDAIPEAASGKAVYFVKDFDYRP